MAPFLTTLFNLSLSTGQLPVALKSAYITSCMKKADMDPADVQSYRPISNLSVFSKLLHSAYHLGHSMETAVLKVLSTQATYLCWCCWTCPRPSTQSTTPFCSDDWRFLTDSVEPCCVGSRPICMFFSILHVINRVRCPSRVGPRTHPFLVIQC